MWNDDGIFWRLTILRSDARASIISGFCPAEGLSATAFAKNSLACAEWTLNDGSPSNSWLVWVRCPCRVVGERGLSVCFVAFARTLMLDDGWKLRTLDARSLSSFSIS